jgi:predicted GIY-YIG superfamily endonuclease
MPPRKDGVARYPSGRRRYDRPHVDGMFVYVVTAQGQGACKVGVSVDPMQRVEALSQSGLIDVQLFWAGALPTREQAFKTEKLAHLYLRENGLVRGRREWFMCSAPFARAEVIRAAAFYGWEFAPEKQIGWVRKEQPVENVGRIRCNLGFHVA